MRTTSSPGFGESADTIWLSGLCSVSFRSPGALRANTPASDHRRHKPRALRDWPANLPREGEQVRRIIDGGQDIAAAEMCRVGEADDEIDDHKSRATAEANCLGEALTLINVSSSTTAPAFGALEFLEQTPEPHDAVVDPVGARACQ